MGESLLVHSPNTEDSCRGEQHLEDVFEASSSCQHYMRPRNQRNKCLSASMGLDLDSIKSLICNMVNKKIREKLVKERKKL
jgi:hypothetical protein